MRTTTGSRSQRGLTLVEMLVAISIFSIMTLGTVPLLATAMKGGATTRTGSVARHVATKALERLRGFQYHVAYSSAPRKVDLLDHFFPARTPAFVPSVGTGYDATSQTYITTCAHGSASEACRALPKSAEIPEGYVVEVRATFRSPTNPATTSPVPLGYAWNGADTPPSDLLEVKVAVTWSVGASTRTYDLQSYLSARGRSGLPTSSGGGGPAPTPAPGGSAVPNSVKLRTEARIDYGYEFTSTYQDAQTPPRLAEFTGTLGTAIAYGEQLDSGSKADLAVRAGQLRMVRPADPAVSGDVGLDVNQQGAVFDAHAPLDATTTATTTAPEQWAFVADFAPNSAGYLAPSEAGTLSGPRGAGPTVAGGLPFVKGYYDYNATTYVSPISSGQTHMWMMPQISGTGPASPSTETTTNPLGLYPASVTKKQVTVNDYLFSTGGGQNVDPRGEVAIDSTPTSPAASREVTATATIPIHGMIRLFHMAYMTNNGGVLAIDQFSANVNCAAKADPTAPSTATGSWSARLTYVSYEGDRKNYGPRPKETTLPVQTRNDPAQHVAYGDTNPLQTIRNLNGGNGPKVYDVDGNFGDSAHDVYLFAGNGKRGLLTGWSAGTVQTSISADDRVASAQLNGAIRLETAPLFGPWPNPSTGQVSQKPYSDMTFSMGKLSCRAEDYR